MPFHMQFLISYSVALGLLVSFCYCIVPKSCKLQKIDEEGGSCQFVAFSYQRLLHEKSNNSFFSHTWNRLYALTTYNACLPRCKQWEKFLLKNRSQEGKEWKPLFLARSARWTRRKWMTLIHWEKFCRIIPVGYSFELRCFQLLRSRIVRRVTSLLIGARAGGQQFARVYFA